jgi:hypothetical protein
MHKKNARSSSTVSPEPEIHDCPEVYRDVPTDGKPEASLFVHGISTIAEISGPFPLPLSCSLRTGIPA